MSARVTASAVAVSAMSAALGKTSASFDSARYSGRNAGPHCEMQCASSMATSRTSSLASASSMRSVISRSGRHVEDARLARGRAAPGGDVLLPRARRVDGLRRDAREPERRDLVLHQGDQRRDHHGQPAQHQRRHLVAQRLARAGRHHRQHVAAGQHRVDGGFLAGAELVEAEDVLQHGALVVHPNFPLGRPYIVPAAPLA